MKVDFYTAFMRAADHIEQQPDSFDFGNCAVPLLDCGTTGCALGWVGFYAHLPIPENSDGYLPVNVVSDGFSKSDMLFYREMDALQNGLKDEFYAESWIHDAQLCAKLMRLYAKRYFQPSRNPVVEKILQSINEAVEEEALTD
jgi:hypothetical protein